MASTGEGGVTGAMGAIKGPRRSGGAAGGMGLSCSSGSTLSSLPPPGPGPASPTGVLLSLHGRARGSGRHCCENQPLRLPPKVKSPRSAAFGWNRCPVPFTSVIFHISGDDSLGISLDEKNFKMSVASLRQKIADILPLSKGLVAHELRGLNKGPLCSEGMPFPEGSYGYGERSW